MTTTTNAPTLTGNCSSRQINNGLGVTQVIYFFDCAALVGKGISKRERDRKVHLSEQALILERVGVRGSWRVVDDRLNESCCPTLTHLSADGRIALERIVEARCDNKYPKRMW